MAEKNKIIKFRVYRDRLRQWRWVAIHRNGKILADSGEAYTRQARCISALIKFQNYIYLGQRSIYLAMEKGGDKLIFQ